MHVDPLLPDVLPGGDRTGLDRALAAGAPVAELLDRALAPLGTPACHLLSASGRTLARTAAARAELPAPRAAELLRAGHGTTVRVDGDGTVFDAWHLHLPEPDRVPPDALRETAELLGRHRRLDAPRRAARTGAAGELVAALDAPDAARLRTALAACGLAEATAYTVVVAALAPCGGPGDAAAALTEALGHLPSAVHAVAEGSGGEATAVVARDPDAGYDVRALLGEVWPLLPACRPGTVPCAGVSGPVDAPERLAAALAQARHALAAARAAGPEAPRVAGLGDLDGLGALLAGVPAEVREVYRATVLGPLLGAGRGSGAMLLDTLETFLAHDCSWARTAQALRVHVNTVHYRVGRIEALTGRDLSRLDHKADLRAALLCR
ncbi:MULTISPECIES: PucR family transcriptional regulator [unclassified Streptomyces]|uniref:PucR family transcriptional regulator n=1 Tax=unclassified Streptomyces TaxID=2593676 RepID=UPI0036FE9B20